jgi:hypothetical protein
VWWHFVECVVIPALRKLRQDDLEYEDSLNYRVRPCLKKKKNVLSTFLSLLACWVKEKIVLNIFA